MRLKNSNRQAKYRGNAWWKYTVPLAAAGQFQSKPRGSSRSVPEERLLWQH
jgi:hypothetical protein